MTLGLETDQAARWAVEARTLLRWSPMRTKTALRGIPREMHVQRSLHIEKEAFK